MNRRGATIGLLLLPPLLFAACGGRDASPSPALRSTALTTPSARPVTPSPSRVHSSPSAPAFTDLVFEQLAVGEGHQLVAVAATPDGFMAGGCRTEQPRIAWTTCATAVVLRSPDGRSWTEMPIERGESADIRAIGVTALGTIAVGAEAVAGTDPSWTAAAWLLEGDRWRRLPLPAPESRVFVDLAAVGKRTVIAATASFPGATVFAGMEAWATEDGTTWERAWVSDLPAVQITAAHPGAALLSTDCADVCGPLVGYQVWRSISGLGWAPDIGGRLFEGATQIRIASWNGTLLAAGSRGFESSLRAAVWLDGTDGWTRRDLPAGEGILSRMVVVTPRGPLILGTDQMAAEPTRGWLSADGATWTTLRVRGLTDLAELAAAEDVIVAVDPSTGLSVAHLPSSAAPSPPSEQLPITTEDGCLREATVTLSMILQLDPADRVRCLGGRSIEFEAWVVPREGLGGVCLGREPAWLASCDPPILLREEPGTEDGAAPIFLDPAASIDPDVGGSFVAVRGTFDHPASVTCRSLEDDPEPISREALTRQCRESFVASELAVLR